MNFNLLQRHLLISILLLNLSFPLLSNQLEVSENITISDGLTHNGVTSILEDHNGYLWVGTYDGLCRYNGFEFDIYKNSYEKDLLINNRIRSIFQDDKNNIWVGTDQGLTLFHYDIEKFENIYLPQKATIKKIVRSKDKLSIICLCENNGAFIFDTNYKLNHHIRIQDELDYRVQLCDIISLDNSRYLVSGINDLYLLDLKEETFKCINLDRKLQLNNSIAKWGDNTIIVPLEKGLGIINYKLIGGEYIFKLQDIKFRNETFNLVSIDSEQNLWVGKHMQGVCKIYPISNFLNGVNFRKDDQNTKNGLVRVSCITESKGRWLWTGSFNKGIYKYDKQQNPFRKFSTELDLPYGLLSNSIQDIAEYDNNRILVTAIRGGAALYNTNKHRFEPFPFDGNKRIGAFFLDSRKDIWFKNWASGKVGRYRQSKNKIEYINSQRYPELLSIRPSSYSEDKLGNIWVGDETQLYKFNIKDGDIISLEKLTEHPLFNKEQKLSKVRHVYADPLFNYIWVGTEKNGLLRVSLENEKPLHQLNITQYKRIKGENSISSNFVSYITRLANGELWIGTENGGICKVINSHQEANFEVYTENNGLSNDVVKAIIPDNESNLWIATNIGLNRFNLTTQTIRRFGREDGLPFEEFWYASEKLKNGKIIFSSPHGFCYFDPYKIVDNEEIPKLDIQELYILNKKISPGDTVNKRVIISERIDNIESISLKHFENTFSLKVNSLHFSKPESHLLKYKLSPLEEEWRSVASDRSIISYGGLPPGEYTLRVMASNSFGQWSAPKEINIKITPPFGKTTQAYLLYLLLALILTTVLILFILKIQRLKHNIEIEHLEKDKIKAVNLEKLRFFSNISHEIKTPVTLISGPVNMLLEEYPNENSINSKLKIVKRQTQKISQLIDQVHDFQRIEANKLEMHYSQFSFNKFIEDSIIDFYFLANRDDKTLKVTKQEQEIFVSADRDKLEKILNNLLSNSFKYTQEGDLINLSYHTKDKYLIIEVDDNGRGIAKEDLPYIFDRFFQSKQKNHQYIGGAGIGLAFSKRLVEMHYGEISAHSMIDQGATFTVKLPIVSKVQQIELEEKALSLEAKSQESRSFVLDENYTHVKVDESLSENKIFLVEDNSEMRSFIQEVLSKNFIVKSYKDGQECIEAIEKEWPDMIISDILMPRVNGLNLCKQIKADIKTCHIPVVLLTACTSFEEEIQGLELGADLYIKKPFNIQYLITAIETILKNRNSLRERFSIKLPLTNTEETKNAKDQVFIDKLYQLIEKNIDNSDFEIDQLTSELYMNRTLFFKKVKSITNQTPYELLKNYRLQKASELLLKDEHNVYEVFLMTGFKSRSHFSRLFKEKYGVAPGKYASYITNQYQ